MHKLKLQQHKIQVKWSNVPTHTAGLTADNETLTTRLSRTLFLQWMHIPVLSFLFPPDDGALCLFFYSPIKLNVKLLTGLQSPQSRACVLPAVTVKYGRLLSNLIIPSFCSIHTQTEAVDHMFHPSINTPVHSHSDGRSGGGSMTRQFYAFQSGS